MPTFAGIPSLNVPLQQSLAKKHGNTTNSHHIISEPPIIENESTSLVNRCALETVLLSTALVEIVGSDNNYYKARALLDSGSQHCIITSSLFEKLNALPIQSSVRIAGVGKTIVQSTHSCKINLRSLYNDYNTEIMCIVLPNITTLLPSVRIDAELNIPQNIKLADPSYSTPSQIDVLIGADHFWDLLVEGRIRLPAGPYLQNTKVGWIVSGPITGDIDTKVSRCCFTQTLPLDEQLRKFWELEEISEPKEYFTADERACENNFNETTKRLNNGRFSVRIPLKETAESLGDSYTTAKNRFLSLERKLERLPHYKQMYSDFIHEYLDLGHMSRIENYTLPCYFLPHHGVFRENSITTKLRVVFNASQKTSSGVSLNDIQLQTPVLQNNLFSILLRFRQYKYVACADIEKMFRQIEIQEDQRNLQLILWRDNPSDSLNVYQLNTVTYGTASAPYLSIRCVRQLGLDCEDEEVARVILDDFYVDDLITGSDNALHLSALCNKVTNVCMSGCLPLRKWISNSPAIAASVGQADNNIINNSKHLSLGENCASKTLGLGWFNKPDQLHFTSKVNTDTTKITKRFILSVVSQIYDPIGLLSPVVIVAKVLLQTLWLSKVDWDDSLPDDVILRWEKFIKSLSNLNNLRIPRHVFGSNAKQIELHLFCDASLAAYGSCAYIRTCSDHGDVTVRLLCAKSRVSPLQTLSIPRLELSSVLVGARLLNKILKSLRVSFDKIVIWTDSTITLGWLRMCPHKLKTFVQNRVVEISELAGNAIFLHVRSEDNPSDLLSRGCSLDELANNDLWWHGPLFLRDRSLNYSLNFSIEQQNLPELKVNDKEKIVLTTVQIDNDISPHLFDFSRFSSFNRMQRTYAYVLRFINNARVADKQQRLTGALLVEELNKSLSVLIKTVQRQSFPVEYDLLINKRPLKTSRSLSSLNIFIDKDDVMRVGGRLVNSLDFSYSKKHPAILCSKHYFTQLLFRYEHIKLLHAGPLLLLAHIRDTWWPVGGRNMARKTVRQCVKCSRLTGKTYQPIMGNLPKERLQPGFPFIRCGVDYAGPLYILNRKGRGSKLEKCYLCLFVCFATRALHLELVTSLSTEYYLMALKRFIARRGKPLQIFSDNGRNFVGSAKELTHFLQDSSRSIIDFASDNHIELKFICPYSAHQGGLWEKGIDVSKRAIMRVVGNANLTYEELSTVLAQIEAVLNSRPMYPMSSDPNDFAPLTPAHFLIGRPLTAPACGDLMTEATTSPPIHTLTRYKRIELLRQHFWRRWSNEYITELQKRTKWQTNRDDIKPDALVVIKEDNQPPLKWQLGRVLAVFPGRDNVSRVANIKTATGIIKRAFTKICPLPVPTSDASDVL